MKREFVAAIAVWLAASSASAYHFSPGGTDINLKGSFRVFYGPGYGFCPFKMRIKTKANGKSAEVIAFASTDQEACPMSSSGFPWLIRPVSVSEAKMQGFNYLIPGLSGNACGPGTAKVQVNGSGIWTFKVQTEGNKDICRLGGSLTSSPPLTIVP